MRITITDVKLADGVDHTETKMVVSGLQELLDTLYPALMNDLDRNGCRDFLYNYASPSFVQQMDADLDDNEMASCLMTFVVQNDDFAMSEDDDKIYLLDVLNAIDGEHELFFVSATIG